jgi:hypothetical protein
LPLDDVRTAVLTSPPYFASRDAAASLLQVYPSWILLFTRLVDATRASHVVIEWRGQFVFLPNRFLTILAGQSPGSDPAESLPEALVLGSAAALAATLHETAGGAHLFSPSAAFAALRAPHWIPMLGDAPAVQYRCVYGPAAERLSDFMLDCAVGKGGLVIERIPPNQLRTPSRSDGGQDGLVRVDGRHFWIQSHGSEAPAFLSGQKTPLKVASQFWRPVGVSQMKARRLERRLQLFGAQLPERADVLYFTFGKMPALRSTGGAPRGVVWEEAMGSGARRQFLWTMPIHVLMTDEP